MRAGEGLIGAQKLLENPVANFCRVLPKSARHRRSHIADVAAVNDVATSAVLFGASDVVAQRAVEKRGLASNDFSRTTRSTSYGGALLRLLVTKELPYMDRLTFQTAARGVLAGVYSRSITLLEGKSVSEVNGRIEKVYIPTIIRNRWACSSRRSSPTLRSCRIMRVVTVSIAPLLQSTYHFLAPASLPLVTIHRQPVPPALQPIETRLPPQQTHAPAVPAANLAEKHPPTRKQTRRLSKEKAVLGASRLE